MARPEILGRPLASSALIPTWIHPTLRGYVRSLSACASRPSYADPAPSSMPTSRPSRQMAAAGVFSALPATERRLIDVKVNAKTDWEIIDPATTEVGLLLGHDPASEAALDYLWRAKDLKGRKMYPMPDFVVAGVPDVAELQRLMIDAASASTASPEEREAVIGIIRKAFASGR
jgi:hypothetical protein